MPPGSGEDEALAVEISGEGAGLGRRIGEGDIAVGSDEVLTAFPVSNAKPEESVARGVKENSWTLLVAEIPRNERVGESGDETVNEARVPPVNAPA